MSGCRDTQHGLRWLWPLVVAAGITGFSDAAPGQSLESAAVEARRMARCLEANDTDCVEQLLHPYSRSRQSARRGRFSSLRQLALQYALIGEGNADRMVYFRLRVGQPDAIEADDDQLYAIVPYTLISYATWWYERRGFWIGVNGDDTDGWQFLEDTSVSDSKIKRIIPGFRGPLPEMNGTQLMAPYPTRSSYLVTEDGAFSIRDGQWNGHYELTLAVLRKIKEPLPLVIAYENPLDRSQPYIVPWLLGEGQNQLRLVSPLITGLKERETYDVFVFGYDPETEKIVFEHRQPLLFFPVADHEELPLPAMTNSQPSAASVPSAVVGTSLSPFPGQCLDPQCQVVVPMDVISRILMTRP